MRGRIEVRDGFVVLLSLMWFADDTGVLPLFLLAAAVHEMGHALVLYFAGGRLLRVTLSACGAVLHCRLPEGRCARAAVCLAGPAASFLLAGAARRGGFFVLAGASALLGAFNLLPAPPLDGGMAAAHLCAGRFGAARAALSLLTALGLAALGAWLFCRGGGVWLLLAAAPAAAQTGKQLANHAARV